MKKVNEIAKELLTAGEVQVVMGYSEGYNGKVRPFFARNIEESERLIFDNRCTQNLTLYLYKKESAALGKPAIVGGINMLRSVIRLAAEKQIKDGDVTTLYVTAEGGISVFRTFGEIENFLSSASLEISDKDKELMTKLDAMTVSERWEFWQGEMGNCIRCYACRQACPLCYCTQCTVEINKPQWIPVGASKLGNLEWHLMRAMHLAGRCIECGQCGEACPVNIPIHLMTFKMAQDAKDQFGFTAGTKTDEGCAISTYQPNDKENFIG